MKKIVNIALSASTALFLSGASLTVPLVANAATIPSIQFSNGQTTIDCTGGATVNATFHNVNVPVNEVVEYVRTQIGTEPFKDTSVGGTLGYQEGNHNITAAIVCPPNTGTYQVDMWTAGTFGGNRSINGGDNVNGAMSFGGAVRVVANAPTPTPPVGTPSEDPIAKIFAAIMAILEKLNSNEEDASCSQYDQYKPLYQTQRSPLVKSFQLFLIGQGESTLATGYFGPMTAAAEASYLADAKCN